ncbi:protein of unknown function [Candidatus Filomicrobium marinum]|uniref:Uncharacterized protein n=1 Tax=Candidatus Filomicrobium marinum TaxID=1608628 RepID=A0A0D6JGC2_9HYPH|nr:protein of unknown function [Candidatus Filomicrobium marinum]CPR20159.1 protein of unknown function [Candidatus Filomicrobium marinum]
MADFAGGGRTARQQSLKLSPARTPLVLKRRERLLYVVQCLHVRMRRLIFMHNVGHPDNDGLREDASLVATERQSVLKRYHSYAPLLVAKFVGVIQPAGEAA